MGSSDFYSVGYRDCDYNQYRGNYYGVSDCDDGCDEDYSSGYGYGYYQNDCYGSSYDDCGCDSYGRGGYGSIDPRRYDALCREMDRFRDMYYNQREETAYLKGVTHSPYGPLNQSYGYGAQNGMMSNGQMNPVWAAFMRPQDRPGSPFNGTYG